MEDPISKPDGAESSSGTDDDAEDTSSVISSLPFESVKKKKMKETREFRDQQKQSKKKSRTASSHSLSEEAEQFVNDGAQWVELGSPNPEVLGSGGPTVTSTIDQMDNELEEEMDATELASVSNPDDDNSFFNGGIQPGQRSPDSQKASHVSETQESLGVPLGNPSTSAPKPKFKY